MKSPVFKIRLQKGDNVIVRSGSLKGKTGKVLATHPTTNMVTVEGLNIVKRHKKPTRLQPQGGIIELTKPMPVSKVGLVDPSTKKASRIAFKLDAKSGHKHRVHAQSTKQVKV